MSRNRKQKLSRREFAGAVALGVAIPAWMGEALAQEEKKPEAPKAQAPPQEEENWLPGGPPGRRAGAGPSLAPGERRGRRLGGVAPLTAALALEQARQAEREIAAGRYRGLLHGIPYGVKDLVATRGIATTWGAPPSKDQGFDYDGAVVRRLREAGAVLVAKLAMIELAGGGGYTNGKASLDHG